MGFKSEEYGLGDRDGVREVDRFGLGWYGCCLRGFFMPGRLPVCPQKTSAALTTRVNKALSIWSF